MVSLPIGLITIFAIVLVPIYIFVIASIVGHPRMPRTALTLLGFPLALLIVSIIAIWLMGLILSTIIP